MRLRSPSDSAARVVSLRLALSAWAVVGSSSTRGWPGFYVVAVFDEDALHDAAL